LNMKEQICAADSIKTVPMFQGLIMTDRNKQYVKGMMQTPLFFASENRKKAREKLPGNNISDPGK